MSLYIRDKEVQELAKQAQKMTGARSLTDTVRNALLNEIERQKSSLKPSERIDRIVEKNKHTFPERLIPKDGQDKAFFDSIWEDE